MDLLTPDLGLLVWNLVIFLLLLWILRKLAWKPILKSLKEREMGISDSLASAEKLKAEMAQMKNENEAMLAQAREERATLIKDAKTTADKMIADAKEKAKAEYDRIVADAQAAIQQQKMAALTEVKNKVGNLVIDVAEKVLRRELSDKGGQENYIKQLAEDVKLN